MNLKNQSGAIRFYNGQSKFIASIESKLHVDSIHRQSMGSDSSNQSIMAKNSVKERAAMFTTM